MGEENENDASGETSGAAATTRSSARKKTAPAPTTTG